VTPEGLAEQLVSRLRPLLPPSVQLQLRGATIKAWMGPKGRIWALLDLGQYLENAPGDLTGACRYVLDHVQDYVAEDLAEIWPQSAQEHLTDFPPPFAEEAGAHIELGYGWPGEVVLSLAPIQTLE
jgi:hypothetical protein